MLVSGDGIQEGTKIANLPGGTDVTLDTAAYKTATDVAITFSFSRNYHNERRGHGNGLQMLL
jgi:hypothetical protein